MEYYAAVQRGFSRFILSDGHKLETFLTTTHGKAVHALWPWISKAKSKVRGPPESWIIVSHVCPECRAEKWPRNWDSSWVYSGKKQDLARAPQNRQNRGKCAHPQADACQGWGIWWGTWATASLVPREPETCRTAYAEDKAKPQQASCGMSLIMSRPWNKWILG